MDLGKIIKCLIIMDKDTKMSDEFLWQVGSFPFVKDSKEEGKIFLVSLHHVTITGNA